MFKVQCQPAWQGTMDAADMVADLRSNVEGVRGGRKCNITLGDWNGASSSKGGRVRPGRRSAFRSDM